MTLTPRQEDIIVAVVNEGGQPGAANRLGVTVRDVEKALREIRWRVGANHTTHAAALLYPRLGDRYRVPARSDTSKMGVGTGRA